MKAVKNRRAKKHWSVFEIVILCIFIFQTCFSLFTLFWAVISSLKTDLEFILNPLGFPQKVDFKYISVLKLFRVGDLTTGYWYLDQLFLNSIITSAVFSAVHLFTVMAMGYVCAIYPFKMSEVLVTGVMVIITIPLIGSTGSSLIFVKKMGLYDTLWGNALLKISFFDMEFLIFYSMFKTLSTGYAEAAFMDGASHFRVMIEIMFPLVSTFAVVSFVTAFMARWENYTESLMYFPSMPTVAYGLHLFRTNSKTSGSTTMLMTAMIISNIPTFFLFLAFKDKMMGDLGYGGLKA